MNRLELKNELDKLKVNPSFYSLDGQLFPDRTILYENYEKWEVFYQDERGGRHDFNIFYSEHDACEYILQYFKSLKSIYKDQ